jgi:hypothetical protein
MIDISSSGLRFATPGPLGPGRKLAVAIDWPVLLDGRVQLQLILAGTVVWSTGFDLKATVVITAPSVSLTPTAAITPKQAQFPINCGEHALPRHGHHHESRW